MAHKNTTEHYRNGEYFGQIKYSTTDNDGRCYLYVSKNGIKIDGGLDYAIFESPIDILRNWVDHHANK